MRKKINIFTFSFFIFFVTLIISWIFFEHKNYVFTNVGENRSTFSLFCEIFAHNYMIFFACLLSLFLGKWLIVVSLLINMGQLGFILGTSTNFVKTFFMLLPHGFFEILSILLMANICWKGIDWVKENKLIFLKYFWIANILIFIAGVIESVYIKIIV